MEEAIFLIQILALLFLLVVSLSLPAKAENPNVFDLSLEDLQGVKVSVASFQEETELNTISGVFSVDESQLQARDANRVIDAVDHLPGIMTSCSLWGSTVFFKGFSNRDATRMFSVLMDGITLNDHSLGSTL